MSSNDFRSTPITLSLSLTQDGVELHGSVMVVDDIHGNYHFGAHSFSSNCDNLHLNLSLRVNNYNQDSLSCSGNSSSTDVILKYPQLLTLMPVPLPFLPGIDNLDSLLSECTPSANFAPVSTGSSTFMPLSPASTNNHPPGSNDSSCIHSVPISSNVVGSSDMFPARSVCTPDMTFLGPLSMSDTYLPILPPNPITDNSTTDVISIHKPLPVMPHVSASPLSSSRRPPVFKSRIDPPNTHIHPYNKRNISKMAKTPPNHSPHPLDGNVVKSPPCRDSLVTVMSSDSPPIYCPAHLSKVPGGFENCTDLFIPPGVELILSYGPSFVPPRCPSFGDFIFHLLKIQNVSEAQGKDPHRYLGDYLLSSYDSFISPLNKPLNNVERALNVNLSVTKSFLREHPDLIVVNSDKSKSLVLMKESEYRSSMNAWIDRCTKKGYYELINDPGVVSRIRTSWYWKQRKLIEQLGAARMVRINSGLPEPYPRNMHLNLLKSNQPDLPLPYMYGVVKTHKPDRPCRPICATRCWYSYWIEKIINHVLKGVLENHNAKSRLLCDSNVQDITKAAEEIRQIKVQPGYVFAKFDVVDMYTSIDRRLILKILNELVYDNDYYNTHGSIPAKLFMECVQFCLSNRLLFSYGGNVYRQNKGLPQGACDSGLLATLVLDYQLQLHFDQLFKRYQVSKWFKYMDDILVYLPAANVEPLRLSLESATQLSFTVDLEDVPSGIDRALLPNVQGCISFLDIYIARCSDYLYLRTYVKPMASCRMIHFLSNSPDDWKRSTIRGYILRILLRSSNLFLLHDLDRLTQILEANMYPTSFTDPISLSVYNEVLKSFDSTLRSKTYDPVHPHHTFGLLSERIRLIRGLRSLLSHVVLDGTPVVERFRSIYDPLPNSAIFNHSDRYVCEDFRYAMKRVFRAVGLGHPTHKNAASLHSRLSLSLMDPDPSNNALTRRSPLYVYSLKCSTCEVVFLLASFKSAHEVLTEVLSNPMSAISLHCDVTGHATPTHLLPTIFTSSDQHNVSPQQQVAFMRVLYLHMGYEVTTTTEIHLLSKYLLSGFLRALKTLPTSYMERFTPPQRVSGTSQLPLPSGTSPTSLPASEISPPFSGDDTSPTCSIRSCSSKVCILLPPSLSFSFSFTFFISYPNSFPLFQ